MDISFPPRDAAGRSPAAILAATLLAALPASQLVAVAPAWAQLSEIVVTAQRRETDLQTTPVSITAFSAEEVALLGTAADVVLAVPGLVGGRQIANSMAATYFLRGVGQDDANTLADPAVGVYVDDVYIARQIANNNFLYDIERIEVLRGPQGILYGRNTTGGAIRIITRKPHEEFGVNGEVAIGNYRMREARASVNLPISEGFYSRLSVYRQERDGTIDNITLGEKSDDVDALGARLALRMEAGESVVVDVTGQFQRSETAGTTSSNLLLPGTGSDLFVTESGFENPFSDVQEARLDVTAAYTGENFAFKSISAYAETKWDFALDFGGSPLPIFVIANDVDSRQFSQEFQFNGTFMDGVLDVTAGLFAFSETNDNEEITSLFGGFLEFLKEYSHRTNAYALYGQAQYRVNDRLTLAAGARGTLENRSISVTQFAFDPVSGGFVRIFDNATLDDLGIPRRLRETDLSPRLGVEYEWNDDLFLFASYTEGFKSASWNQRANSADEFVPFKPERVKAVEAGLKSYLFDRRMSLNVSVFQNNYDDFIVNQISDEGVFLTTNAAEVRVRGAEAESALRLTERLTATGSLGYMRGKYTSLDEGVPFPITNEPKFMPRWTGNLGLRYVLWSGPAGELRATGDYFHSSRYFVGLQNEDAEHVPIINLYNLGLGFTSASERWSVTGFCRNCGNREYFTTALAAAALGFETQIAAPPRMYGVRVGFNFE